MRDTLERAPASARILREGLRQATSPLSDCQRRVWRLAAAHPETMWVQRIAFRFSGPFAVAVLAAAWRELVRRHGTLRTVFLSFDGEPRQCVRSSMRDGLSLMDLEALPNERRAAAAARVMTRDARLPIDIRRGPLMRAVVTRLTATEHVLALTLHHLICDGWSCAVLLRELTALMHAHSTARDVSSVLPPLRVQYAELTRAEQDANDAGRRARKLQEVVARLRDRRSPITVPIDRPRPLHTSHRAAAIPFVLPDHVSRDLRAVARREGMTTFMLGLAALALAVRAEVPTASEATFGIAVANRPSVEAQALIGAFVNIVVVRLVMPAELTVRDLLRQARAAMLDAFAYQDVPFDDAMEALEPGTPKGSYGPQGGEPLFRVCVDFQEGGDRPTAPPPDLTVTAIDADEAKSGCDLFLSLSSDLNTLRGLLLYSTELYELRTALNFVDRLQAAFAALATRLDCRATEVCRGPEVRA